jgi:hypothetical protein
MFHSNTVSSATLELLKRLMRDNRLTDFFLVGGTALSLQIGHRISIDLDLFTVSDFKEEEILAHLTNEYGFSLDFRSKNTLKGEINGVKIDLIAHQYPLVKPFVVEGDIRMAGLEDISAMKLNAVAGYGRRIKDFIDLAYLSSFLTAAQIKEAYAEKYASTNPVMALKALDYHNDIDFTEKIEILDKGYSWSKIESRLKDMLISPHKLFEPLSETVQSHKRVKRIRPRL